MRLSVLICTLSSRMMSASGLIHKLEEQARGLPVEIVYLGDNKTMTVGTKRNHLLRVAGGDYACFVDDDDRVAPTYVSDILKATETGPDCVVFDVEISENSGPYKRVVYDKDFECDKNFPDRYERLPNHLMPVSAYVLGHWHQDDVFPDVSSGEDFAYARRLKTYIKTQVRVPKTLYYYDYSTALSETSR
jgi:glycosyltransferase involved in cell wall biosynthesis